jgi:hypothetical protein
MDSVGLNSGEWSPFATIEMAMPVTLPAFADQLMLSQEQIGRLPTPPAMTTCAVKEARHSGGPSGLIR